MSKFWPSPIEERLSRRRETAPVESKVVDLTDIEETQNGLSPNKGAMPLSRELVSLPGRPLKDDTGDASDFVVLHNRKPCDGGKYFKNLERIYPVVNGYEGISMNATSFNMSVTDAMKFDLHTADFLNRFPHDCARALLSYRIAALNVLLKAKWDTATRRIAIVCRRGCCLLTVTGTRDRNVYFASICVEHSCSSHEEDRSCQITLDVTGMPWLDPRMSNMFCDKAQCYTLDFFVQTFMS